MTLEEKCKQLPRIISNAGIELKFPGHYSYPEDVCTFIDKFYELDLIDQNYLNHHRSLCECKTKYNKSKRNYIYEELTLEDLLTICTYIIRGERFCEGMINSCLRDGSFQKVINKLIEGDYK